MDYMREINAFYAWLETHPLPHPARHLWHALMHVANRAGWRKTLSVPMTVLVSKTGMGEAAIRRARAELAQAGRLAVRSRGQNLAPLYTLTPLAESRFEGALEGAFDRAPKGTAKGAGKRASARASGGAGGSLSIPDANQDPHQHQDGGLGSPRSAPGEDKQVFGLFGNVLLTSAERAALTGKLGEAPSAEMIERLSAYVASKGARYKSHYATLLAWHRRDGGGGSGGSGGSAASHSGVHNGATASAALMRLYERVQKGEVKAHDV